MQAAERSGNKIYLAVVHENLGTQLYFGGQFSEGRSNLDRAITYYRDAAGERRTVLACQRLSRIFLAEGDLDRAYEQAERGRMLAQEVGDRWSAECDAALGAVHSARAAWTEAEARFRQALEVQQRVGHLVGTTDSLLGLGLVYERRGEWPLAEAEYRKAQTIVSEMDPGSGRSRRGVTSGGCCSGWAISRRPPARSSRRWPWPSRCHRLSNTRRRCWRRRPPARPGRGDGHRARRAGDRRSDHAGDLDRRRRAAGRPCISAPAAMTTLRSVSRRSCPPPRRSGAACARAGPAGWPGGWQPRATRSRVLRERWRRRYGISTLPRRRTSAP